MAYITMKMISKAGLGQSLGLGLLLVVGCAGLMTLMSMAS